MVSLSQVHAQAQAQAQALAQAQAAQAQAMAKQANIAPPGTTRDPQRKNIFLTNFLSSFSGTRPLITKMNNFKKGTLLKFT